MHSRGGRQVPRRTRGAAPARPGVLPLAVGRLDPARPGAQGVMSLKLRRRVRLESEPAGDSEQLVPAGSAPAPAGAEPPRRAEHFWPAATGLVLGLLALGPALGRGFVLSY